MKTLIVDDDNIMRRILKRATMALGHEVTGCINAELALEAFQSDFYSLVLLDWMLPGMDGLELCRRIRKLPHGDRCIIIMITAKNRSEDLLQVLDAGADDYIAKPVDVRILKTRITVAERMYSNIILRKEAEEEKERLIRELQEALDRIKILRGSHTCCSFCSKIKDAKGNWVEISELVKQAENSMFAEGICPACMRDHSKELNTEGT